MKNMKLRKIICLLLVTCSSCSFFAGCTDDINNYEKQTAAEASNKVFISDKYASLAFNAQRTVEGKVANMDTLVAKLVPGGYPAPDSRSQWPPGPHPRPPPGREPGSRRLPGRRSHCGPPGIRQSPPRPGGARPST